jgi:hypothetical protein
MKKLIFILFLFVGLGLSAQSVKYDYRQIQTLDTFNISTVDTSWTFGVTANYSGSVQVYWTKLVGTLDGLFKMQATLDNVNWVDMNLSSYTPADTVGSTIFHITRGSATDYRYIRLLFDRNSITGGQIIPSAIFNKTSK